MLPNKPMTRSFGVGSALLLGAAAFGGGGVQLFRGFETCSDTVGFRDACIWVHWYNASRLMHRLRRRPPVEAEAEYYAHLQVGQHTDHT